jgi:hypothetical protein
VSNQTPHGGLTTLRGDSSPPSPPNNNRLFLLLYKLPALGIPVKSEYMVQYPDEAAVWRKFQKLQTNFLRNCKVENHKSLAEEILYAPEVTGQKWSLKIHFLDLNLDLSPVNLSNDSEA